LNIFYLQALLSGLAVYVVISQTLLLNCPIITTIDTVAAAAATAAAATAAVVLATLLSLSLSLPLLS
jgi:hypothetical protein